VTGSGGPVRRVVRALPRNPVAQRRYAGGTGTDPAITGEPPEETPPAGE
jgi:hypothetical protein